MPDGKCRSGSLLLTDQVDGLRQCLNAFHYGGQFGLDVRWGFTRNCMRGLWLERVDQLQVWLLVTDR